jgi:hypothetical protein
LLLFIVLFVSLAAGYYVVAWQQERASQAERAARRLFSVKAEDISEIVLHKAGGDIVLVRQPEGWTLAQPLAAKADPETAQDQANLLASLEMDRDLGELADPQAYGLHQPSLVVSFTAQGKNYRLAVGQPTPGNLGFYVQRDGEKRLFTISQGVKDSLDRPEAAFRDKRLFVFAVEQVEGVKLTVGPTVMELEKTAAGAWRWVGRDEVKVRKDRLESFLRHLTLARIKEFLTADPQDPKALGFDPAPVAQLAVAVAGHPPQQLMVGARRENDFYAKKEAQGALFLVESEVAQRIMSIAGNLEDRRLWFGDPGEVARLRWGPPDKPWTGVKEKDGWKLSDPEGQGVRQPAVRVEAALIKLQELEFLRLLPAPPAGKREYLVEVQDGANQLLCRLAQVGKPDKEHLVVILERSGKLEGAWLPRQEFEQWQKDISRLTQPPAPEDKETPPPKSSRR